MRHVYICWQEPGARKELLSLRATILLPVHVEMLAKLFGLAEPKRALCVGRHVSGDIKGRSYLWTLRRKVAIESLEYCLMRPPKCRAIRRRRSRGNRGRRSDVRRECGKGRPRLCGESCVWDRRWVRCSRRIRPWCSRSRSRSRSCCGSNELLQCSRIESAGGLEKKDLIQKKET